MRLLLNISLGKNRVLPINYPYYLGAWLYHTLRRADADFASFLHEKGFSSSDKTYKLMTFGPLQIYPYQIDRQAATIESLNGRLTWELRFYVPLAGEDFIRGLFLNRSFTLGNSDHTVEGEVTTAELLPEPVYSPVMQYRLVSPTCISYQGPQDKYPQYLSPEHPMYTGLLLQNLLRKAQAALSAGHAAGMTSDQPPVFRLLDTPRPKLLTVKAGRPDETRVRGFLYSFEFEAPKDLQRVGFLCGFGEKNASLGMGVAEEKIPAQGHSRP